MTTMRESSKFVNGWLHLGRGTHPTASSWNEILSIHGFFDILAVTSATGQAMGQRVQGPWYIPFLVGRIERCGSAFSQLSWLKANGMCSDVQKQLDEHLNHWIECRELIRTLQGFRLLSLSLCLCFGNWAVWQTFLTRWENNASDADHSTLWPFGLENHRAIRTMTEHCSTRRFGMRCEFPSLWICRSSLISHLHISKCSAPALDAARAVTTVFEKRCHN